MYHALNTDAALCVKEWVWFMNDTDAFDVMSPKSGGWFLLSCSDGALWFNEGQWEAVMEYWVGEPVVPGGFELFWGKDDEI
jgi:hypothetical protein